MKLEDIVKKATELEGTVEWTLTDAVKSPAISWEILDLLIKEEAVITEIVGKANKTWRTNYSTIKEMANLRKKMLKYAKTDTDDTYSSYYYEIADVLNTYAANVILNMYEVDDTIIAKACELKEEARKAKADNLAKARASRKKGK